MASFDENNDNTLLILADAVVKQEAIERQGATLLDTTRATVARCYNEANMMMFNRVCMYIKCRTAGWLKSLSRDAVSIEMYAMARNNAIRHSTMSSYRDAGNAGNAADKDTVVEDCGPELECAVLEMMRWIAGHRGGFQERYKFAWSRVRVWLACEWPIDVFGYDAADQSHRDNKIDALIGNALLQRCNNRMQH